MDRIFTKPGSLVELNDAADDRSQAAAASSTEMRSSIRNKVIAMRGPNVISQVVIMEPRSFEEMAEAILALRERKTVVLNMTTFDPEQAQRAIDFVSGATYAIDANPQSISEGIFLFAPSCVFVSS